MAREPRQYDAIEALMRDPADASALAAAMVAESRLPGPRANLELIDRFATLAPRQDGLLPTLLSWIRLATPPNDPREFLSSAAAVSLGAVAAQSSPESFEPLLLELRRSANDPRWRVREGVAMGLQRIGEADFSRLMELLERWNGDASPLERRAIVAALAHPPILKEQHAALRAQSLGETVAMSLLDVRTADLGSEPVKVLVQGLSYALSVLTAAEPAAGFAMLGRIAATGDPLLRKIVRANLGKNRLIRAFPERTRSLLAAIDASA